MKLFSLALAIALVVPALAPAATKPNHVKRHKASHLKVKHYKNR